MSVKKLLNTWKENKPSPRVKARRYTNKPTYDELVEFEAELGKTVFGPIPGDRQREFFKDRENVWIWYERFPDATGAVREMTVRYDIRPTGVFKKASNGRFEKLSGQELINFQAAVRNYLQLVKTKLYC